MKIINLRTSIHDALGFAKNCQLYAKDIGYDQLANDKLSMSAIQYNLIVLSEALKRIASASPISIEGDFVKEFIAPGEELLDKYNNVDSYKIWTSISSNLPRLVSTLEKLLTDKK
jgi:uncharacterized protein with HEPN domain